MAKSALLPVLTAVYARLQGDGSVTDEIFNGVPKDQPSPYLTIQELEEDPDNTFERRGKRVFFEVHAVSEHIGDKLALELLDPAVESLDEHDLVVVGFSNGFKIRHQGTEPSTILTSLALKRSIAARFEIFVQQDAP